MSSEFPNKIWHDGNMRLDRMCAPDEAVYALSVDEGGDEATVRLQHNSVLVLEYTLRKPFDITQAGMVCRCLLDRIRAQEEDCRIVDAVNSLNGYIDSMLLNPRRSDFTGTLLRTYVKNALELLSGVAPFSLPSENDLLSMNEDALTYLFYHLDNFRKTLPGRGVYIYGGVNAVVDLARKAGIPGMGQCPDDHYCFEHPTLLENLARADTFLMEREAL